MKTFKKVIAAVCCLALSASAQASIYKADFTFSGFSPYSWIGGTSSLTPPQNVVTGSITYEAMSMYDTATAVDAFDLSIAGHTYAINEVVFDPRYAGAFGGVKNGIAIGFGTGDFFLSLASDSVGASTGRLFYSPAGIETIFASNAAAVTISDLSNDVPEPGSLALLLAGAVGLGFAGRRKKRSSK